MRGPRAVRSAADAHAWQDQGACRESVEDFYPLPGDASALAAAKGVCGTCPVIAECLTWALEHEDYGVWGGTGERARATLRRRHNRQARESAQADEREQAATG